MTLEEVVFNDYILMGLILLCLFAIVKLILVVIVRPIKTYLLKRKNVMLLDNCKDCIHFYQDDKYNCHCDIMEITGICDPKNKYCYRT